MKKAWHLAARNLRRNIKRNVATIAAIAFGFAGLVVIGGYGNRAEHFLRTNAVYLQHTGHVTIYLKGGLVHASSDPVHFQLDEAAQEKLLGFAAQDKRVEFSARYLQGVGLAGNSCNSYPTSLLGVEPVKLAQTRMHPMVQKWSRDISSAASGKWIDALPSVPHAVMVSSGLAVLLEKPRVYEETIGLLPAPRVLHCDTEQRKEELARDANVQLIGINYEGTFAAIDSEMVGTYHPSETLGEDGSILASLATMQEWLATKQITYVGFYLRSEADAASVAKDVVQAMAKQGLQVEAFTYDDETLKPYYVGTMSFLNAMTAIVTGMVNIVLALTILGAMTLTILERTKEIGTLRSLGFMRRQITALVLREALLVALIGLSLGLVAGLMGAQAINAMGIRYAPPGVPGTIALMIVPHLWLCAIQAAVAIPLLGVTAWFVVSSQVRRNVVELLTEHTG